MGSGASAPTDEKSQSPTLGGIGIWSPSCWWCFYAFVMFELRQRCRFLLWNTYRILVLVKWKVFRCVFAKQIYQISTFWLCSTWKKSPNGLDEHRHWKYPNDFHWQCDRCQSASISLQYWKWAVYGGLHQDCFGQISFKIFRWWFQTCLYVQPPI